jgi:hypothetical protein
MGRSSLDKHLVFAFLEVDEKELYRSPTVHCVSEGNARECATCSRVLSRLSEPRPDLVGLDGANKRKRRNSMKKRILVMASLFVLCSFAATQVARAQEPMLVNIPFAFTAGEATLPAGEYRVEKMDGNSAVLLIRCTEPTASAFVVTNATGGGKQQEQSKLVFNRYKDHYFLSQVWNAGYSSGRQLRKTSQEKEIAQLAKLETQGQVILLARVSPSKP